VASASEFAVLSPLLRQSPERLLGTRGISLSGERLYLLPSKDQYDLVLVSTPSLLSNMEKREPSHTNYRRRPTPSITKTLWESLLVFSTPARGLILGLLCTSWTFRALPKVLAQDPAVTDRSSTFQVLADGTQDLAALIGLFATDSVERYSVDYSRGYLSVAVATCSLLGILGYVRALVKLAMGSKACQDSAFPTGDPPHCHLPRKYSLLQFRVQQHQYGPSLA
jgi:hypothetical protein